MAAVSGCLRSRLVRFAGGKRLQFITDVESGAWNEKHLLPNRSVSVQVERQLVLTGRDLQALEESVELVNRPCEISVDVDLRVARLHLNPRRRGGEAFACGVGRPACEGDDTQSGRRTRSTCLCS